MKVTTLNLFVVFILALGTGWFLMSKIAEASKEIEEINKTRIVILEEVDEKKPLPSGTTVALPRPNTVITSPVKVIGYAPGTWYFEANIVIKIIDENGILLGQGPATAQSDWMTTALVPFEASIPFVASGGKGFVVIEADNPAGFDNPPSFRVPVEFAISDVGVECTPGSIAGTCVRTGSKS